MDRSFWGPGILDLRKTHKTSHVARNGQHRVVAVMIVTGVLTGIAAAKRGSAFPGYTPLEFLSFLWAT